ncbi:MAG: VCBS repeat-containing protein [FCB group bacterium]|nr:VCBS repeat-containing protein [FCB group bacterium]
MIYSGILPILCVLLWLSPQQLEGGRLHVEGTWDLDHDGTSELLKFDRTGSPTLQWVEINQDGSHAPVWTFSLPDDWYGWITDVHPADVDGDGTPELLASFLSMDPTLDSSPAWLLLFRWNGTGFDDPVPVVDESESEAPMRPLSFSVFQTLNQSYIAVAQSAPARQVMLMVLNITDSEAQVIPVLPLQPKALANGVNPLFTRPVKVAGQTQLAIFALEPPLFKLELYDLRSITAPVLEATIAIKPTAQLLGFETLVRDTDGDGNDDLILPLDDDRVFKISLGTDPVTLDSTTYSGKGLFQLDAGSSEFAITQNFISRIEAGLYESLSRLPEPPVETESGVEEDFISAYREPVTIDSNAIQVTYLDTLEPGDTLRYTVMADSGKGTFHQFRWLDIPPTSARFNPDSLWIEWVPDSLTLGSVSFLFQVDKKIGERLVRSRDLMGETHLVIPITQSLVTQLHAFVKVPAEWMAVAESPEDTMLAPPSGREELYSILVITPQKGPEKRYIFDGVPPFSVMVEKIPVEGSATTLLGHHIAADLGGIQRDTQVSFDYSRTDIPDTAIQTLTLIHDLESNLLTLQLTPPMDTVLQSYQPKLVDPDLSAFPNYFFQGFPSGFSTDSLTQVLEFPFSDSSQTTPTTSSIALTSPTIPPHTLHLYFNGGDLLAIRGEVKVRDNGMKKTITEIDVTPVFNPLFMNAQLKGYMEQPDETEPVLPDTTTVTPADTSADTLAPELPETLPDSTIQSLLEISIPPPDTFIQRWEPGFFLSSNRCPSRP